MSHDSLEVTPVPASRPRTWSCRVPLGHFWKQEGVATFQRGKLVQVSIQCPDCGEGEVTRYLERDDGMT